MKNILFIGLLLIATNAFAQKASNRSLKELSWMIGDWEGKAGNSSFYEGYELKNDTLIIIKYYTDATLSKVKGEGKVYLENGEIYHTSGRAKWKVSNRSENTWHFIPLINASNQFKWISIDHGSWKAELISAGRVTTYPLSRITTK